MNFPQIQCTKAISKGDTRRLKINLTLVKETMLHKRFKKQKHKLLE